MLGDPRTRENSKEGNVQMGEREELRTTTAKDSDSHTRKGQEASKTTTKVENDPGVEVRKSSNSGK